MRQQAVPADQTNGDHMAICDLDTVSTETLESSEVVYAAPRETLESIKAVDAAPTETLESSEADIASDELSCDLCEHRSQTNGGLKIHMGR